MALRCYGNRCLKWPLLYHHSSRMLLQQGTENGQQSSRNEEQGTVNFERRKESEEQRTRSGEWETTEYEERRMGNNGV